MCMFSSRQCRETSKGIECVGGMYLPSERLVWIGFVVGGLRGVVERGRGGKVRCGDNDL
jgi:hypothetical protein